MADDEADREADRRADRGRWTEIAAIAEPLDDQLGRTAKMDAVARLAGSVAHDFNNILTAINGYADLALGGLDESDPTHDDVLEIRRSGDRANDLTKRLLALGRRQVLNPTVLLADPLLFESRPVLERAAGSARLEFIPAAPDAHVKVDGGQLVTVLGHLIENARVALADAGTIVLASRVVMAPAETVTDRAVPDGGWLRLMVVDQGTGMTDEIRRHACEPFFTSHPSVAGRGLGAGLGLAIAWGMVTQSGGHVGIGSAPGVGTAVRMYLPIVDNPGV